MSMHPGFELPEDFNTNGYDLIRKLADNLIKTKPFFSENWLEYSFGWCAVAFRFKALAYHDEEFRKTLTDNTFMGLYVQERELLNFFVNGLSVIETFTYSLYFIGRFIKPEIFNDKIHDIKLFQTKEKFSKGFRDFELSKFLEDLFIDENLIEWKKIRNSLVHRSIPNRTISLTIDGNIKPSDIWHLKELKIDESLTIERRKWLAETLSNGFIETIKLLEKL